MLKATSLTKSLFNHQSHSQPIQLYTPSNTSSSGSACDTDASSMSSSYKSNNGLISDEINHNHPTESNLVLVALIDKLKRDIATIKQAKTKLEILYKVKCKSDLDKSAQITKLRLQFEYELQTFCKQDQQDFVRYLQRQLLARDQRIAEQLHDIEQLKDGLLSSNGIEHNGHGNKKLAPVQILRSSDPDVVISANRHLYDEQDRSLQRQNIELNDRVKRFERQLETLKHEQPKDHDKELVKRAIAKQANKDAIEYQRILAKKDEEIEQLNGRVEQLSKPGILESALRQANIEKLHLERRLMSTSSTNSTTTTSGGQLID